MLRDDKKESAVYLRYCWYDRHYGEARNVVYRRNEGYLHDVKHERERERNARRVINMSLFGQGEHRCEDKYCLEKALNVSLWTNFKERAESSRPASSSL